MNFGQLLQSIKDYFNPTQVGSASSPRPNFWTTPATQGLANVQKFIENPAPITFHFADQIQNPVLRTVASVPQSILNVPSDILTSGNQLGTDIRTGQISNPRILVSDVARAALPIATIATMGGVGTAAKAIGAKTIGQLLKEGTITGAKYGAGFGGLTGAESGRNIENPIDYAKNLALNIGTGAGYGAAFGAGTGIAFKGIPEAIKAYKASPLADESGFIGAKQPIAGVSGKTGKVPSTPTVSEILSGQPKQTTLKPELFKQLTDMGYSNEQLGKIGNREAQKIILNNTAPFEHSSFVSPEVPTTAVPSVAKQTGAAAEIASAQGSKFNDFFSQVKNTSQDFATRFQKFVGAQKASDIEGIVARKKFAGLGNQGLDAILSYQKGNKGFAPVKSFFDSWYKQLNSAGIKFNYKANYLPQLWADSADVVQQKLGKTLGQKPSFTMESLIKDYQEGIKAGLTPRFQTVGDLAGWYESTARKALANKDFFTSLIKSGEIMPSTKAPSDWVTLDNEHFPRYVSQIPGGGNYSGSYSAPAPIAETINNYLRPVDQTIGAIAGATSRSKNIVLSSGIPYTGINFHGINIWWRNLAVSKNPISAAVKGAYWLVNPGAAEKHLMGNAENLAFAKKMVKEGNLTLTTEEHAFDRLKTPNVGNILSRGVKGLNDAQQKLFEHPLFNQIIPSMKVDYAKQIYQDFLKKGIAEPEALKLAGEITNNAFGGINYEAIGRSRSMQGFIRMVILAPDWAETSLRLGKGTIQGLIHFQDPKFAPYRTLVRNLIGSYFAANIANKIFSGHYMWENDGNNLFNIDTGTSTADGKKRFIRPFGTAADFVRIPVEAAVGAAKGDFTGFTNTLGNRLSTPLAAAERILTDTDYTGSPVGVRGTDRYGRPMSPTDRVLGITSVLAAAGTPQEVPALLDVAAGKSNMEQALERTIEAPIKYQGGAYTDAQKTLVSDLQNAGLSGDTISAVLKAKRQSSSTSGSSTTPTVNPVNNPNAPVLFTGSLPSGTPKSGGYLPMGNASPKTIKDILAKKQATADTNKLISDVEQGNGGYSALTPQQKSQIYQSKGITPDMVNNWYVSQLKSSPAADRASFIMNQLSPNFASLYSSGVLTTDVAKELQRQGFVPSADELMKTVKLTDPYYKAKAQTTLKIKLAKNSASTMKKLLSSSTSQSKKVSTMLAKSSKVKVKKPKTIKIKYPKVATSKLRKVKIPRYA